MNGSRALPARSAALAGAAVAAALTLAGCHGGSSSAAGASSGTKAGTKAAASPSTKAATTTAASYYPLGAGDTWVYSMQGFGGKGTVTNKMLSVTPSAAGQVVTMDTSTTYPLRKTTKETLIFEPDGSIQMPLSQFMGGASVTLERGQILWPSASQLASGTPFRDTIVMKMNMAGHSETLTMPVVVKGEGTVSVTVPAGTYQASLIDETMTSSIEGYKVSVAVRTWVANGVGPVKSEVTSGLFSGSGSPSSTEVLKAFTKG